VRTARAALEAIAPQSRDVLIAMQKDVASRSAFFASTEAPRRATS
jgi:glycerol kinase